MAERIGIAGSGAIARAWPASRPSAVGSSCGARPSHTPPGCGLIERRGGAGGGSVKVSATPVAAGRDVRRGGDLRAGGREGAVLADLGSAAPRHTSPPRRRRCRSPTGAGPGAPSCSSACTCSTPCRRWSFEWSSPRRPPRDARARARALRALGKKAVEVPDTPGVRGQPPAVPVPFARCACSSDTGVAPSGHRHCMTLGAGIPWARWRCSITWGWTWPPRWGRPIGVTVPARVERARGRGRARARSPAAASTPTDAPPLQQHEDPGRLTFRGD